MSYKSKMARIPQELADEIKILADLENRSFTGQVVQLLEEQLRIRDAFPFFRANGQLDTIINIMAGNKEDEEQ